MNCLRCKGLVVQDGENDWFCLNCGERTVLTTIEPYAKYIELPYLTNGSKTSLVSYESHSDRQKMVKISNVIH